MEAALFIYAASFVAKFVDVLSFGVMLFSLLSIGLCVALFIAKTETIYDFQVREYGKTKEEIRADRMEMFKKPAKVSIIAFSIFMTAFCIVPSERTMYLMAGAYIGQQALTSEVSQDLQDVVGLQVKKYKKELQEQVK